MMNGLYTWILKHHRMIRPVAVLFIVFKNLFGVLGSSLTYNLFISNLFSLRNTLDILRSDGIDLKYQFIVLHHNISVTSVN